VNVRVFIIKSVHSLVLFWVAFCIAYLFYAVLAGDYGTLMIVALGSTILEGLVVAANRGACPLRALAERYGAENGSVTELFLPKPVARNAFRVAFPFLGLELVALTARYFIR
jgi:hypothetical protein